MAWRIDERARGWLQRVTLLLTCLMCIGMVLQLREVVLALPLVPLGLALARGRTWALFGMTALTATIGSAVALGASPWFSATAVLASLAPALYARRLWRADAPAAAFWFLLSAAAGGALTLALMVDPAPTPAGPHPEEPTIATRVAPLYPTTLPVVPLRRVCSARKGPRDGGPYVTRVVFDFEDQKLEPLAHGPTLDQRPPLLPRRTTGELARQLENHRDALRRCYRWARQQTGRRLGHATVSLELDVGLWGVVTRTRAVSWDRGASDLVRCVQDVLAGLQLAEARPLRTTYITSLLFLPSGQGEPRRKLKRPRPGKPRPPVAWGCLLVPKVAGPRDRVATTLPLLTVGDFDRAQAERERLRSCRRRGVRCRAQPTVTACSVQVQAMPDKEHILRTLRHNVGAFRRCYRAALLLRPTLTGRYVLSGSISPTGLVDPWVDAPEGGDAALAKCMRRALARMTFRPGPNRVVFRYPLVLSPWRRRPGVVPTRDLWALPTRDTVERVQEQADWHLRRGDGAGALVSYSALLRARPRSAVACHWRLGAVLAMTQIAPWIDHRVERAFQGLAAHLRRDFGGVYSGQCAARAARALLPLATGPHRRGNRTNDEHALRQAAGWYRRLLALRPSPAQAHELYFYLAEALYKQRRHFKALAAYKQALRFGGQYSKEAAVGARYSRHRLSVKR